VFGLRRKWEVLKSAQPVRKKRQPLLQEVKSLNQQLTIYAGYMLMISLIK